MQPAARELRRAARRGTASSGAAGSWPTRPFIVAGKPWTVVHRVLVLALHALLLGQVLLGTRGLKSDRGCDREAW